MVQIAKTLRAQCLSLQQENAELLRELSSGLDQRHSNFIENMIANKKVLKINSGVQTNLFEKEEASTGLKGEIEIITLDVGL